MAIYWNDGTFIKLQWSDGEELYHYGIQGQKWGVQNGPPYPLGSKQLSSRERHKRYDKPHNKTTKKLTKKRSVAQQVAYEEILTALGITAGTAAAAVMIGYIQANPNNMFTDYNASLSPFLYKITNKKFLDPSDGSAVGSRASMLGYQRSKSSDIANTITNIDTNTLTELQDNLGQRGVNELCQSVRKDVRDTNSPRRLSCWSASNAYYMSVLTGNKYASKSFNNLVDFNTFGELYNKNPDIFKFDGSLANNFVGKYGHSGDRCDYNDCKTLLYSIAKNIKLDGNGTGGLYTVGFINAGYTGTQCTHQFNFDILKQDNGTSLLHIADGYTGRRYPVCTLANNTIDQYNFDGLKEFTNEMHHYNKDSVRFYAPSLNSINPDTMSGVILTHNKTKQTINW